MKRTSGRCARHSSSATPATGAALRESLRASVAATADADPNRCRVAAEIDERQAIDRLVHLGTAEAQAVPTA